MNTEYLRRLRAHLWEREWVSRGQKRAMWLGRFSYVLARDLWDGQLNMRAISLVYTTLLSVVPLLALAFSVLKALGVHNSLEPLLLELLRPLGTQGHEITANVIKFVENIQVGVLGSVGVALLFYATVSMIHKVESSFNYIWRVEEGRPLSQRLGEYLAVITVGPVLVFSALGLTATLMSSDLMARVASVEPFGFLLNSLTQLLPYLLIIGLFTFLYRFVTNTQVNMRAALAGGVAAGVMWQTGSLAFASFVSNATNYNAIYSGFAILIFLLIWLYFGWLILLIGCQLAFYVQHPEHVQPHRVMPLLSCRETEYLSLLVMRLTGQRFLKGEPPLALEELVKLLDAPPDHVQRVTRHLTLQGLLTTTGTRDTQLMPAKDLDAISLGELWRLVRSDNSPLPRARNADAKRALELLELSESTVDESFAGETLRQWLLKTGKSG